MRGIEDKRWDALDGLYTDDAVVEYPFALPAPMRLDGRDAIRRYFAAAAAFPCDCGPTTWSSMRLADPGVVVAEWDYEGVVTTTAIRSACRTSRCRRFVTGRSWPPRYHNHVVLAGVTGRLPSLLDTIIEYTVP